MCMLLESIDAQTLDVNQGLKQNLILNDLHGKEYDLVIDGLWQLGGEEIDSFRSDTMKAAPPKSFGVPIGSIWSRLQRDWG